MQKYSVITETLDKKHPYHPGQMVYRIIEVFSGKRSLAYYLTEDTAWNIARKKEAKLGYHNNAKT